MKAEFDRLNYTLEGRRQYRNIHPNIVNLFAPPPALRDGGGEADDEQETLVDAPAPPAADTSLDPEGLDFYGGEGLCLNKQGVRCRRDNHGRMYPIDKYGNRITSRLGKNDKPESMQPHAWWSMQPAQRADWWRKERARLAELDKGQQALKDAFDAANAFGESSSAPSGAQGSTSRGSAAASYASGSKPSPALCCKMGLGGLLDSSLRYDNSQRVIASAVASPVKPASPSPSADVQGCLPWDVLDKEIKNENDYKAFVNTHGPKTVDSDDTPLRYAVPCMPLRLPWEADSDPSGTPWTCALSINQAEHREKIAPRSLPFAAMVARPVGKAEIARTPKARESLRIEWDRLRTEAVWDDSSVREWSDIAREARDAGTEVHLGYLFALCVEKNSELPAGHEKRKFKGRVVFQGNRVINQNWDAAMFQDLGSCPASMEASKAADCYGSVPDFDIEIADAVQAYVQAALQGTPTWVCLPPEERPASWSKFRKPVVRPP